MFLKEGDRISMECHVDSLPSSRWEARDKSLNVVWQGSADPGFVCELPERSKGCSDRTE